MKIDQQGFSLIEVLVAMVVSAIVSLGVLQINTNMMVSQKRFQQASSIADFQFLVKSYLTSTQNCTTALSGIPDITVDPGALTIGSWSTGSDVSQGVSLERIDFDGYVPGESTLPVRFYLKKDNGRGGQVDVSFVHNVSITPSSSSSPIQVTECLRDDQDDIKKYACEVLGGVYDDSTGFCEHPSGITAPTHPDGQNAPENYLNGYLIDSSWLMDSWVTGSRISNSHIDDTNTFEARLEDNTISSNHIIDAQIMEADLALNAVTGPKVADDAITHSKIADGAIIGSKIPDSTIRSQHIRNFQITTDHIINDQVTSDKIANNQITSDKIDNNTILKEDIRSNQLDCQNLVVDVYWRCLPVGCDYGDVMIREYSSTNSPGCGGYQSRLCKKRKRVCPFVD
jgi:prepilin-type N-terminal cleavage/methylation domain-containing protein